MCIYIYIYFILDNFASLFPSLSGLHSSIIFSVIGGQWNAIEIINDVFGFPRSTASDERSCDNDSLLSVIEENQQRSWKGDQDAKDGRQGQGGPFASTVQRGSGDNRLMEIMP